MKAVRDVLLIFAKDMAQYYSKAPTLSWGLLFPVSIVVLLGYYAGGIGAWRTIPGLIALTLLFSATTMPHVALGFDKVSGGIQLLIHAPVSSSSIVVGKALGGVFLGLIGVGLSTLALTMIGGALPLLNPAFLVAGLVLGALTFSFLSVTISALMETTQAVAVLNFMRFTMIFLGGGLLPKAVIPQFILPITYSFPLVYVADLIRYGTYNMYEFVDPATALICAVIYFAVVTAVAFRVTLRTLTP